MRLLEWQAKKLFKEHQIPVPNSVVVSSTEELQKCQFPAVMKAQVPIGGRGKAGAIKLVHDQNQAVEYFNQLQTLNVRGFITRSVLVEELAAIQQELYLSMLYDKVTNQPLIIASPVGGMDIEQVAKDTPDKIIKIQFDQILGIQEFMVRYLAKHLGVTDVKALGKIVRGIYEIFVSADAVLVEINPLGLTDKGLVALDGKIDLDDKAESRQAEFYQQILSEQTYQTFEKKTPSEELAKQFSTKYVPLNGSVGIITDGAGTGMLTLDLVNDEGGKPANFCELGGLANPESAYNAIKVVLANPSVKVLLISLIGGLTRMDEMAEGIAMYVREFKEPVPFVIRMCGTKEEEGREILGKVGLKTFYDISEAVREAVSLAREK